VTSEYKKTYRLEWCIMLQSGNCASDGGGSTEREWCSYRESHHFDIYTHNLKHSSLKALFLCFQARKQNLRDQNATVTYRVHVWFIRPTISCMHVWVVIDHPINNGRTTVRQAYTYIHTYIRISNSSRTFIAAVNCLQCPIGKLVHYWFLTLMVGNYWW
jgi:hypothetical protein